MADPRPPRPDAVIPDRILKLEQRVRELELSSGTQRANAVATLQATVDELAETVTALNAAVTFLQTQTVYASLSNFSNYVRGSASGVNLESFDGTYDLSISVTTGASGKLVCSVGGNVAADASAAIGLEVVGAVSPDLTNSVMTDETIAASRTVLVTLAPNTAYTVRTRRWYTGPGGAVFYGYPTLAVTKLA